MTGGCCSTLITRASTLVPPLSQQFKVLIVLRHHRNILRYATSYVPITLSLHIYLGACSEPVGFDSAYNTIRFFVTAISTKPHRLPFFRQSHISMRATV